MHLFSRRKAFLPATLLAIIIGSAAFIAVRPGHVAYALTNCTVADNTFDSEEAAFLGLINTYRQQNSLPALAASANLNRAASWLAVDMASLAYFSHTDSAGRSPSTRAQNCGYPSGAGENIAAGTVRDTAQEAFDAWKASSGHNANMLNSSYRMIGIARYYLVSAPYRWYWVTDFGLVDDGSGGGSATATPTTAATATPTAAAAVQVKAVLLTPLPGSLLSGSTVTFTWAPASSGLEYFVYAGSSLGSNTYLGQSRGLNTSVTATSLPTNGSTVYFRLWTRFATGWQYNDYTYTAANGGTTATAKAQITSPAAGSRLPGATATFTWSAGSGALQYYLYAGSTAGSNNYYSASAGTSLAAAVGTLPTNGTTVYVRLWTRFASGWQYNDYTFLAAVQ